MALSLCHLTICLLWATVTVHCKQPHILFIVADDYGWNDIGYHGSEIHTPNLDRLAGEGVKLDNYYVQQSCSPTRSQLMSGRYQIHTGLQHSVIRPSVPNALPLDFPTLADKLKEQNYSTHIVGKWHLGFYKSEFLPTNRGFDSFYGYLSGHEGYYNHVDCYHAYCGLDLRDNLDIVRDQNDTYSTHLFADQVKRVVELHTQTNSDKPLFMYVPFQAVHGPLQVPDIYLKKYTYIKDKNRRTYAAMVSALDEAVQNITETFQTAGLWEDTLLVFSTDNGGKPKHGGNNYPLKGEKGTHWEGGIRGVGFVHGNMIQAPKRTAKQLMHVSDWFPTLVNLAGGETTDLNLDGHNVWQAISEDAPSPRRELLHSIDPRSKPWGKRLHPTLFDTRISGSIRVGEWKLITGDPGLNKAHHKRPPGLEVESLEREPSNVKGKDQKKNKWLYNIQKDLYEYQDRSEEQEANDVEGGSQGKNTWLYNIEEDLYDYQTEEQEAYDVEGGSQEKNVWLYNIEEDPYEYQDRSADSPEMVYRLLQRLTYYNDTAVPCRFPDEDPDSNPSKHGGVWGPWLD